MNFGWANQFYSVLTTTNHNNLMPVYLNPAVNPGSEQGQEAEVYIVGRFWQNVTIPFWSPGNLAMCQIHGYTTWLIILASTLSHGIGKADYTANKKYYRDEQYIMRTLWVQIRVQSAGLSHIDVANSRNSFQPTCIRNQLIMSHQTSCQDVSEVIIAARVLYLSVTIYVEWLQRNTAVAATIWRFRSSTTCKSFLSAIKINRASSDPSQTDSIKWKLRGRNSTYTVLSQISKQTSLYKHRFEVYTSDGAIRRRKYGLQLIQ